DPAALVEYYTKVLGAPTFAEGGYAGWAIGSGWVYGGADPGVNGDIPMPGRIIWNIESDDVPGDFERMKAAGAIVVAEPYSFDADGTMSPASIATFADTDGNYFQLTSPFETYRPREPPPAEC